jgi:predicted membrane-bound spermidine synthase
LVLVVGAIAVPLARRAKPEGRVDRPLAAALFYFAAIGVGFMLAEIALLQRLSLVLGHPSYSLMVVLSSLVGAMGLGSLLSDQLPLAKKPWCFVYPVVLALLVALVALAWSRFAPGISRAPTPTRVGFAVGLCAGLGLPLGCAFPVGMRLVRLSHDRETPWLWGINGVGSVLSSSLAMLIALAWGLTDLMLVSAALYLTLVPAAWVLVRSSKR